MTVSPGSLSMTERQELYELAGAGGRKPATPRRRAQSYSPLTPIPVDFKSSETFVML